MVAVAKPVQVLPQNLIFLRTDSHGPHRVARLADSRALADEVMSSGLTGPAAWAPTTDRLRPRRGPALSAAVPASRLSCGNDRDRAPAFSRPVCAGRWLKPVPGV